MKAGLAGARGAACGLLWLGQHPGCPVTGNRLLRHFWAGSRCFWNWETTFEGFRKWKTTETCLGSPRPRPETCDKESRGGSETVSGPRAATAYRRSALFLPNQGCSPTLISTRILTPSFVFQSILFSYYFLIWMSDRDINSILLSYWRHIFSDLD